jgi:drug/metabolite transporter (DMT)-like permease
VRNRRASTVNPHTVGALLMVASAAAWAIGLVSSKSVLELTKASPVAILTVQLSASAMALLIVKGIRKQSFGRSLRQGWPGLLEPGIAYQLSLLGLGLTSASNATVVASLEPVVIPVLLWLWIRQRPTRVQTVMTLLATAGAIMAAWDGESGNSNLTGDLLVFASVVAAAAYVVVSSRHVADNDPFTIAAAQQIWALILTVVIAGVLTATAGTLHWPTSGWHLIATAATGWCNYALPFTLYLSALRFLPLESAASYLSLIPVIGLAGSHFWLGEPITIIQISGSAIVVMALIGITRWGSGHRPSAMVHDTSRYV